MSHLRLACLGSPVVTLDGQTVAFPTRKVLALLVYLAAEGGAHAREKLAALFWPAQDRPQGQQALRTTLTRLRQALQDRHTDQQTAVYLRIDQHMIGFNGEADCELDVRILQEAVRTLGTGAGRADTAAQNLFLQRAVGCYRGDFLDGFTLPDAPTFDDWIAIQRERYHRQIGLVFEQLSHNQFDTGQIAAAIDTATRWLAHDTLDEAAYRQLMRLHFANGDRAAALQVYEACRTTLAAELAAEPVPETAALAAQLRATAPPGDDRLRHAADSSVSPAALQTPLIGREREHARLVDAFDTVRRGQAGVVCIEGEAGIGKSALALHFLGWAAAQGADVLRGQAFETGGQLPYQPLLQALRPRLDRENAPEDLLADVWLTELSRLLPELRDRYPDLAVPTSEDATARTRLFESIVRLYLAIAERAPLVLFVDDVQWADAATLDLLHYANRRWVEVGAPILLLLALRAETLATNIPLAEWYTGMQRDRSPLRLELGPLTIEDTLRLVQALIPERLAADRRPAIEQFSHWLFAETSGQPLYMLETLKALAEQGVLAAQAATGGLWHLDIASVRNPSSLRGLLPPRIREVVRTRLARLSPQAITLLSAGAILGQNLTFGQLWRVANLDEDQALSALDELVRSQLLRRAEIRQRASADPTYAFSHDKIRDVVYTEAGDARRFVFHRRAFEILQAASAAPAILAYHAARAGLMEAAFHYNVVAGDAALQLFAVRDAIMFYELARQGLAESSENGMPEASTSAASWQQLYTQLGRAYELDNQFDNAREIYQALLGLARSLGEPAHEWTALNRLATVATLGSMDLEAALALLHEAREVAERNGDQAGLAETEWNLAQARFYQPGAWAAALAHGESALARARNLGLVELSARCLNIIARASNGLHAWAAVEAAASEAQAVYAALGDRALEADCLCNVAAARIYRGDTAAGISAGWAARAINLEIANTWGQVYSAIHLTLGLVDHGALREALEVAEHAVATGRTHGVRMLPAVLARLGTVYRTLLDLDAARAAHEEALSLAERIPGQVFVALAAAELCADAALQGAWAEAYQYALRAAAAKSYSLAYVGFTGWLEVEALLRGGDSALVNELMRWLSQHARNYPRYQLAHLRCQAVLARWEGRNTQAQEYLLSSSGLAAELDLPCEQWPIQAELAELYRSSGDEARARVAAAQAAAILQSLVERIDDRQLQAGLLATIHTIAGN